MISLIWLKAIAVFSSNLPCQVPVQESVLLRTQNIKTRRHEGKNRDTHSHEIQLKLFFCLFQAFKFWPFILRNASIKHIMSSLFFCERKVHSIRGRFVEICLNEMQQLRNWKFLFQFLHALPGQKHLNFSM